MTKKSTSPDKNKALINSFINRSTEQDPELDPLVISIRKMNAIDLYNDDDPERWKNNMEHDLRTCEWMLTKVRECDRYAQNLYAAMCNNEFIQCDDTWNILKENYWHASWRSAGGIIADMRETGDYMDWYCSGSGGPMGGMELAGYLPEGVVSDEIEADFLTLGWKIVPYAD